MLPRRCGRRLDGFSVRSSASLYTNQTTAYSLSQRKALTSTTRQDGSVLGVALHAARKYEPTKQTRAEHGSVAVSLHCCALITNLNLVAPKSNSDSLRGEGKTRADSSHRCHLGMVNLRPQSFKLIFWQLQSGERNSGEGWDVTSKPQLKPDSLPLVAKRARLISGITGAHVYNL
ncbi:hypothetical protein BC835DRAFT_669234 [Cytidiella melzeri]|nr:hypothetical protein BC835DRAFT_669234 [Cytidiella melzeri]